MGTNFELDNLYRDLVSKQMSPLDINLYYGETFEDIINGPIFSYIDDTIHNGPHMEVCSVKCKFNYQTSEQFEKFNIIAKG